MLGRTLFRFTRISAHHYLFATRDESETKSGGPGGQETDGKSDMHLARTIATSRRISSIGRRSFHATIMSQQRKARKAGVASPEELRDFVARAGSQLLVVDVRNPDASVEPGDQKSLAVAALPSEACRPMAKNLIFDRDAKAMPLPDVNKETPIITHCGGGGRGQKAKDYLMANGFTNVLNGGGPKETDCWAEFGDK